MGIPVTDGRGFDDRDTATSMRVAIVNDVLAAHYFGGGAIGRHLVDSQSTDFEIVGAVRSGAYLSLHEPPVPACITRCRRRAPASSTSSRAPL